MREEISVLEETLKRFDARLIAVTKTRTTEEIMKAYELGVRDFGENRVQELVEKQSRLPGDIRWHLIGHLQKNKVKYLAPFLHCIHSVDSAGLVKVINKEGIKNQRIISILIQIKIASEDTKFGMDTEDARLLIDRFVQGRFPHVNICGFMGMATYTDDMDQVRKEFKALRAFRDTMAHEYADAAVQLKELSMGMTGDFEVALEEGSTMIRIGSLIFGPRV